MVINGSDKYQLTVFEFVFVVVVEHVDGGAHGTVFDDFGVGGVEGVVDVVVVGQLHGGG